MVLDIFFWAWLYFLGFFFFWGGGGLVFFVFLLLAHAFNNDQSKLCPRKKIFISGKHGAIGSKICRLIILHYLLSGDISRLNFSNLASTGFHIYSLLNSVLNFKCFKIHEYGLLRIIDCYIREIAISGFNIMIERKKATCFSQNLV